MKKTLLLLCCLTSFTVVAGEIKSLNVVHADGRYTVDMDVIVHAPMSSVRHVMTDYDNLKTVNPIIIESKRLSSRDQHHHRIQIVTRGCVLFFCITMSRTQDIEERADGDIIGVFIPQQSDFRYGRSHWHLEPVNDHTRVVYHSEQEPAFWVPPLIGPWVIKRKLYEETERTINGIELRAKSLLQ